MVDSAVRSAASAGLDLVVEAVVERKDRASVDSAALTAVDWEAAPSAADTAAGSAVGWVEAGSAVG